MLPENAPDVEDVRDELIEILMERHIMEKTCDSCGTADYYEHVAGRSSTRNCTNPECDDTVKT